MIIINFLFSIPPADSYYIDRKAISNENWDIKFVFRNLPQSFMTSTIPIIIVHRYKKDKNIYSTYLKFECKDFKGIFGVLINKNCKTNSPIFLIQGSPAEFEEGKNFINQVETKIENKNFSFDITNILAFVYQFKIKFKDKPETYLIVANFYKELFEIWDDYMIERKLYNRLNRGIFLYQYIKYINVLQEGLKKFPGNKYIVPTLIFGYLLSPVYTVEKEEKEINKLLKYIDRKDIIYYYLYLEFSAYSFEKANNYLKKAFLFNPNYEPVYLIIGRTYINWYKYKELESFYIKYLKKEKANNLALLVLFNFYIATEKFNKANYIYQNLKNNVSEKKLGELFKDFFPETPEWIHNYKKFCTIHSEDLLLSKMLKFLLEHNKWSIKN